MDMTAQHIVSELKRKAIPEGKISENTDSGYDGGKGVDIPSYSGDNRNGKTFSPTELKGIHHKIIHMHCHGMKNIDIADHLNCSAAMVGYTINSQVGKQQIQIIRAGLDAEFIQVQRHLQELAPLAVLTTGSIMLDENENGNTRLKASENIMKATGHMNDGQASSVHITVDDLNEIKRKAKNNMNTVSEAEIIEENDV